MQEEAPMQSNDSEILQIVERAILNRTWGRVSNLCVESRGELVVIAGSTKTYYLKQLALEAARQALATTRPFLIDIDVN
jgi:hypothetical protein